MNTETYQIAVNILSGLMLVAGVFMLGRVRVRSLLRLFAAQSFALALLAVVAAVAESRPHLWITAIVVFAVKTIFIPLFMVSVVVKGRVPERLISVMRPSLSMFASALLVFFGFYLTISFMPQPGENFFVTAVAISLVLIGLLALVTRKGLYWQIIGFLIMENGIFALGLALTGGMPLLVEIGIFLDVTIGAILMALISYRVHDLEKSVDTKALETLTD